MPASGPPWPPPRSRRCIAPRSTADGARKAVAVKILRPGIERRFKSDLDAFFYAARKAESLSARGAAAAAGRGGGDARPLGDDGNGFPAGGGRAVRDGGEHARGRRTSACRRWTGTAPRARCSRWNGSTARRSTIAPRSRPRAIDLPALGHNVIQSFLRHALRDGFFHADMHPGNLFVDADGRLVAVDFGIMGRLGPKERRFLAEILFGFITRDYQRTAQMHFDAGYVPRHHSVESFAQAIRAIGEPIHNRTAEDISMAKLLMLLFEVTGLFDMRTRPELLLLQKTMVVVEGVARTLDPKLDMWSVADPVVREWIERNLGPAGRLEDVAEGAGEIGRFAAQVPSLLTPRRHADRPVRRHHPRRPGAVAGDGGSDRPRRAAPQPLDRGRAVDHRGATGVGGLAAAVSRRLPSPRKSGEREINSPAALPTYRCSASSRPSCRPASAARSGPCRRRRFAE